MRDTVQWRVYFIEGKTDWQAALERYELATGAKPRRVRVSEKAPEDLLYLVREIPGLEIEILRPILPRDVWLTHEEEQKEPQMSLFGEVEG
ncbi:hypothetical protein [Anaerolinea sp.]|uniref:hypothetical protein n=1 Tax=Anaerolinea sp. TaxID=1872519 RepID=UPI002ACDFFC0|nr:hypothetical protein [Anaerolinea sp.]